MVDLHFNTKPEDIELPRIKRRAQYIYDITQQDFDWFVTLTFRYKKTDHDEVVLLAKKFFDSLSADLFGKRSKKRIIHFSAIERHTDGYLHIHVLLKEPKPETPIGKEQMKSLVRAKWLAVSGSNLDMSAHKNSSGEDDDLKRFSS
ncbi:hypothetical protein GCM10011450_25050 [Advenella faeciporci]|uniref:Replication-associated protein ORF2/G2P domain-containing protein n=1 Tax=Advenella faeciporci TaxID=797535 RepID=A0A918MZS8_9BURK|nr:hypothetical protein [Advenella faeciporci]GGW94044.1 hypothetical protein GCM10011450_25050 [Advenella faeciporci]